MAFINNNYMPSGNVYIVSGVSWTGVGSITGNVTSNGQNIATETTVAKIALPQGNGTTGQNGPLIQGAVGSAVPAYTNATTNPLSLNTVGQLRTETILSGTNYITGSVNIAAAPPTWTGVGSVLVNGSVNIGGTPTVQPLIGSMYGIGIGSFYSQVLGSVQITNSLLSTSGPIQNYGNGSGTTAWNPLMVESGAAATPQRLVVTNNTVWVGVGSVLVTGSVNIGGTASVTSNGANIATETTLAKLAPSQGATTAGQSAPLIQGAVGSVAPSFTHLTSNPISMNVAGQLRVEAQISGATIPVWAGAGSIYGIGVGSVYAAIGAPATIGSLAIQNVQGIVGNAQTATGSPFLDGFVGRTANPTAVTDGQVVYATSDKLGRQVVVHHHIRDLIVLPGSPAQLTASGTAVRLLGSGAASVFHDAIALYMTNTGSINTTVFITDATGSATNHIFTLAAGGGAVIHPLAAWPQRWSNSHWDATLNTAVNAPVYIEIQAVKNL